VIEDGATQLAVDLTAQVLAPDQADVELHAGDIEIGLVDRA